MRPDFGCGIHDLVFAAVYGPARRRRSRRRCATRCAPTRPRIERPARDGRHRRLADGGCLDVVIDYEVRATNQPGNFVYPFYFRESASR